MSAASARKQQLVLPWVTKIARMLVLSMVPLVIVGCPEVVPPPVDNTPGPGLGPAIAGGFNIEIQDVRIPLDRRPVIDFVATDDEGNGIPLGEITDVRVILDYLEVPNAGSTARYVSYTTTIENPDGVANSGDEAVQAAYDSGRLAAVTQDGNGTLTYRFAAALPTGFDIDVTHQLGVQASRLATIDETTYPTNVLHVFRPDGRAVTATREIVNTDTCNQCHTQMSLHGSRREVQLCILCHNGQSSDAQSGNTVDFPAMIHSIHRGAALPSVESGTPYQIIGFRNTVHDYSTVVFPQDIRNCQVCHTDAPQADVFKTSPTIAGCASCHDRTWFGSEDSMPEDYEMHVGGAQADDSLCALCHTPTAPGPAPILESHLIPFDSAAAPGLSFAISEVIVTPPAKGVAGDASVQIAFLAETGDGTPITDITTLGTVATTLAYPAPEFETYAREQINNPTGAENGTLVNNGDGTYLYTFEAVVPADSTETFAVAMEGRVAFEFRGASYNQGTSSNAYTLFTVDGEEPEERRSVVDEESCLTCHSEIRAHGSLRTGVEYCVMCHNPNNTDISRRPEGELPPATVNFKDLIHKVHRGEDLQEDYTVYGFGSTPYTFNHVRFPGFLNECSICHIDGSTDLPLADEALPTTVTQDNGATLISETLPTRAACTSCHDGEFSNAHALANTVGNVESCSVCHGPSADFAVESIHAMAP